MGVFKAYDIRGIYPDELDEDLAYRVGLAFGGPQESVVLGRDWRRGSEQLYNAVLEGLLDAGTTIYALGDVPTPLVSFAVRVTGASGGLMITASHNPPQYNGIKPFTRNGFPFTPSELSELKERLNVVKPSEEDGYVVNVDVWGKYLETLPEAKHVRVGFDAGNGVGATYLRVLEQLFDVHAINTEKDPNFSARGPEPTEETVRSLVSLVQEKDLDFGLAVDGDGDRAYFVWRDGGINPSFLYVLFGRWFLERGKNVFVATIDLSRRIEAYLSGARIYRVRVGTSFVAEKAREVGAHFAGEYSRHFIAYEFSGHSDPVFFACVLSHFVPLSSWFQRFPFPPTASSSLHVRNKGKAIKRAENIAERIISRIDGVEFELLGHRVLVRPSNTEEKVRIYVEGEDPERVLRKVEEALASV